MNKLIQQKTLMWLSTGVVMALLSACATMPRDFQKPTVVVTSFKPVIPDSLSPQFDIVLHVTNPNRIPLKLEGMIYSVKLDGNKVLSGVANELPVVPAYGEEDIPLRATADLSGSFHLLVGLIRGLKTNVDYQLDATLDLGAMRPKVDVSESGNLSLLPPRSSTDDTRKRPDGAV